MSLDVVRSSEKYLWEVGEAHVPNHEDCRHGEPLGEGVEVLLKASVLSHRHRHDPGDGWVPPGDQLVNKSN